MSRIRGVAGLCAVAAAGLTAHAADPALLPGGFAGVDVLFVVAGFLAARRLSADLAPDGAGLGAHYRALVVRAAPATLAMLAAVGAAAWALLPAQAIGDVGLTLAAGALFAANLVFAATTDVAAPAARAEPLLHLWALGVATQVLLVLPLIALAVGRLAPGRMRGALIALTVLSYWAAVWGVNLDPARAVHMPHMRAWEFLIGALLVHGDLPEGRAAAQRAGLAAVGLAAILGAFLLFDASLRAPGVATMAPVLGAAMVIHAGRMGPNPVSALLDARPLAAAGAATLSIYLWHWPPLAIARVVAPGPAGTLVALGVAALAAWLSWRVAERRGAGLAASLVGMAAMAAAGTLAVLG